MPMRPTLLGRFISPHGWYPRPMQPHSPPMGSRHRTANPRGLELKSIFQVIKDFFCVGNRGSGGGILRKSMTDGFSRGCPSPGDVGQKWPKLATAGPLPRPWGLRLGPTQWTGRGRCPSWATRNHALGLLLVVSFRANWSPIQAPLRVAPYHFVGRYPTPGREGHVGGVTAAQVLA